MYAIVQWGNKLNGVLSVKKEPEDKEISTAWKVFKQEYKASVFLLIV